MVQMSSSVVLALVELFFWRRVSSFLITSSMINFISPINFKFKSKLKIVITCIPNIKILSRSPQRSERLGYCIDIYCPLGKEFGSQNEFLYLLAFREHNLFAFLIRERVFSYYSQDHPSIYTHYFWTQKKKEPKYSKQTYQRKEKQIFPKRERKPYTTAKRK